MTKRKKLPKIRPWHIRLDKTNSNSTLGMAIPAGLEPATNSLEGCCSIQLSYGTVVVPPLAQAGARPNPLA